MQNSISPIKYIVLCLLFYSSIASSKIIEVYDLSKVEEEISSCDKILHSTNQMAANRLVDEILNNSQFVPIGKYPENFLESQILLKWKPVLVDAKTPLIIKKMQEKGVR